MIEEVLIVGAGPVGLTTAVELWRRGVRARIITKSVDLSKESRAIGINPVTMSLLEPSGVTERLIAAGTKIEHSFIHFEHGGVASLDLRNIESKFRFMLALPQSHTERILSTVLEELGGRVEHDTALESLEQEGGIVRCHVSSPSGTEVIEARTVIGADSAHSVARKSIGVEFPGDSIEKEWTIADVRLDWEYPHNELHAFISDYSFFMGITIGDGSHRIICPDAQYEKYLPPGATITEEVWRSKFRVHYRQATTYQVGRVFLAGDAAHVHSPLGGRGMNLGIRDAVTLARLLVEGNEVEYTNICRPIGAKTIAAVRRLTMIMASEAWWLKRLMGIILPLALRFPPLQRIPSSLVTSLQ